MSMISAITIQDKKFNDLGLSKTIVNKEQIAVYSRSLGGASEFNPILVLIHGYPQSAFEYVHHMLHNEKYADRQTDGVM